MTESTDKVAVGNLTGMEPRNSGWFRFTIQEPGRQYPVRLDTKKPELVEQCKALMGTLVRASYGEQESTNVNPNTGKPYTNRYLNAVASASPEDVSSQPTQTAPVGAAAQQQTHAQGPSETVRELRIMRMGASERAVAMLSAGLLPEGQQNMEGLVELAEAWVAYYVYGATRFGVPSFDAGQAQETAPPASEEQQQQLIPDVCAQCGWKEGQHARGCPNSPGDDDIPF